MAAERGQGQGRETGGQQAGRDVTVAKPVRGPIPAAGDKIAVRQVPQHPPGLRQVDEGVATILARDAYQRDRHYFLMRSAMVLGACLCVSVLLNALLISQPVKREYFLSDTEGRIRQLTSLDTPVNSLTEISTWVSMSIAKAYTFSFANYRAELQDAQANFTAPGWRGFERALQESGTLQSVINNKYITTAVPTAAPVLVQQGLRDGLYAWKFEVPFIVTFQSANGRTSQTMMISATVVRQPETANPRGLGIAQLIAQ